MTFETIDPASGQLLRRYPFDSAAKVESAVRGAAEAQRGWRHLSPEDRAKAIAALARVLRDRKRKLAQIITQEMGKPYREAAAEVASTL